MGCRPDLRIRTLIITGQSDHNWAESSENLKTILELTGRFRAEVEVLSAEGVSRYRPDFGRYGLVVLDYAGEEWPESTRNDFIDYLQAGGGLVVYHQSLTAFPGWIEYGEITGLEASATDPVPSEPHSFLIESVVPEHPIMAGLPQRWLHSEDMLYGHVPVSSGNVLTLATAFSDTVRGGSGLPEPVLMATSFGQGRIFITTLGHSDERGSSAMQCAGFVVTLQRGAEWAATGAVTQQLPPDLPNAASEVRWPQFRPLNLDELMEQIAVYEVSRSRRHLADFSERLRKSDGNPETYAAYEQKMIDLLASKTATSEAKRQICRELSWMGSAKAIPILEGLLDDPELSDMAHFALQRLRP